MDHRQAFWPDVTDNWYTTQEALDGVLRSARKALNATHAPQVIHLHPMGVACIRGNCQLLGSGHP